MENAPENVRKIIEELISITTQYGLDVLGALLILILGWWIAGWGRRATFNALGRVPNFDGTLRPFLASTVKYAIIIITLIAVLNQFGVQTTSIIAVLGAAGLAVGLALQGTLANVAAGVMLLILRPFRLGDFIDAGGQAGTVVEIGLFAAELKTPDGIYKSVPNSSIWGATITNFSRNPTRRLDVLAGISYDDDVDGAMTLLRGLLDSDERILKEPEPQVMLMALADSSVNINLRAWTRIEDYWPTLFDLNKRVKLELEAAGYTIPFPQRDVHVHHVQGEPAK